MERLGEDLRKIDEIGVRLIWGERDPVVPLDSARGLMNPLSNVQLQTIAEVGHLPYEECPEAFEEAVWAALAALSRGQISPSPHKEDQGALRAEERTRFRGDR